MICLELDVNKEKRGEEKRGEERRRDERRTEGEVQEVGRRRRMRG